MPFAILNPASLGQSGVRDGAHTDDQTVEKQGLSGREAHLRLLAHPGELVGHDAPAEIDAPLGMRTDHRVGDLGRDGAGQRAGGELDDADLAVTSAGGGGQFEADEPCAEDPDPAPGPSVRPDAQGVIVGAQGQRAPTSAGIGSRRGCAPTARSSRS